MDTKRCPTCGAVIPPGRSTCDVCPAPADAPGAACPHRGAGLPPEAVVCVDCGFDLKRGRLLHTEVEGPGSEIEDRGARPEFGRGLPGLVARATHALLDDPDSPSSVRVRGLRHVALGFLVLVGWIGIVA